jgi:hypothetical protein
MKKLALLLGLFAVVAAGCATPGYSGRERSQRIARNWGYEWRQMNDDIDHFLLLRPASGLTMWNVHSSD